MLHTLAEGGREVIGIYNMTRGKVGKDSVCDYELLINFSVIARFKHRRSDGLSVCLLKASKAAEAAEVLALESAFNSDKKGGGDA